MAKRKILIVDDENVLARQLEGRLTRLGYGVAAIASSGSEAIAMMPHLTPDLVLMDMALGGTMTGASTSHGVSSSRARAVQPH